MGQIFFMLSKQGDGKKVAINNSLKQPLKDAWNKGNQEWTWQQL
jgi:hypothetical protein